MSAHKGSKPWNAGTGKGWTDKRGYRWIYVTENGKRRAKREHREIMEQHIGRKLTPEEVVHHKNENKSDNRIENLEIKLWSEHTTMHCSGSKRTDYVKRTQSVIAEYRETNKHLRYINSELMDALMPTINLAMWTESAADDELVIMSVGTVRKMRTAITKALGEQK